MTAYRRSTKTNHELVEMINNYWGQKVARVVRVTDTVVTPGEGFVTREVIASSLVNGLPPTGEGVLS